MPLSPIHTHSNTTSNSPVSGLPGQQGRALAAVPAVQLQPQEGMSLLDERPPVPQFMPAASTAVPTAQLQERAAFIPAAGVAIPTVRLQEQAPFQLKPVVQRKIMLGGKPITKEEISEAKRMIGQLNTIKKVEGGGLQNFDVSMEYGETLLDFLLTEDVPHQFANMQGLMSNIKELNDSLVVAKRTQAKEKEKPKEPEKGPFLLKILPIFEEAINLSREVRKRVLGENEEALILDALRLATNNLLFEMKTKGGVEAYPSLDTLNSVADLQVGRQFIVNKEAPIIDDDYDHVDSSRETMDNPEVFGEEEVARVERELAARVMIRKNKRADTWLKYAQPYVEVKGAFLDGWTNNEHGSIEKRGFYYLMRRTRDQAKSEVAGNSDQQAAIAEPSSGKVRLAIALGEVYDTAACHDDAIQFVELLGPVAKANGKVKGGPDKVRLLEAAAVQILQLLTGGKAPLRGVRLRESGNHSLVLLFEQLGDALTGTKFETTAGRNTDKILYFMEKFSAKSLTAAPVLIKNGLEKVTQVAKPGWELEWEVFEVAGTDKLRENLARQIMGAATGVAEGLQINKEEHDERDDLFAGTPKVLMKDETAAHVRSVIDSKPAYLERKRQAALGQQQAQQNREAQELQFKVALDVAKGQGDAAITVALRNIFTALGEDKTYMIAGKSNIAFERVQKLLPEIME
jgi:hypothetical protein